MNKKDILLNNLMTQCAKKLIKLSDEEEQRRVDEINNCHHLFVKLRNYDNQRSFDINLDVVECVHCGLTNKFKDLESTLLKYPKSLEYYITTCFHSINTEYNNSTIETIMFNNIDNRDIENNLISDKVLRSFHPEILYDIARFINSEANNEELFEIMSELNELETSDEKSKLISIFDAKKLIERYFDSCNEVKMYIKRK